MIDKNGKLFGRINIIDLFLPCDNTGRARSSCSGRECSRLKNRSSGRKILLTMFQEEVNTFTASNVKPGDPVTESFQNISFGELVDIEISDSINWGADQEGKQVRTKKDGFVSVKLVMETPGKAGPSGITIGGAKYYVGQFLVIRVGTSAFYARIDSAEQIN